jgi:hypothetical protein
MAKLFDTYERIVPTWLAASRHLLSCDYHTGRNLILEISRPNALTSDDKAIVRTVDAKLRSRDPEISVDTVANTIFPQRLYAHYKRPSFYSRYLQVMARAKKPGTWGTYAMRMIERRAANGKGTINPLEIVVGKLHRAAHDGHGYQSDYEIGFIDTAVDLPDCALDFGCELPLYEPGTDARKVSNMPCLSHLSFKLTQRTTVDMTAIYRSHHYGKRALGNLIGLSRLLSFVAGEAGLAIGTLTVVSTHAELDVSSLGGVAAAKAMFEGFPY